MDGYFSPIYTYYICLFDLFVYMAIFTLYRDRYGLSNGVTVSEVLNENLIGYLCDVFGSNAYDNGIRIY